MKAVGHKFAPRLTDVTMRKFLWKETTPAGGWQKLNHGLQQQHRLLRIVCWRCRFVNWLRKRAFKDHFNQPQQLRRWHVLYKYFTFTNWDFYSRYNLVKMLLSEGPMLPEQFDHPVPNKMNATGSPNPGGCSKN